MMHFEIDRYVPQFIMRDKTGYAMAKAIEAGMNLMIEKLDEGTALVNDIDRMPEWRLDEMAWELGAEWYDASADIDSKREQIRSAYKVYSKLGTPKAVVDALEAVFGDGRLEEWYSYGGEPYHYRVFTTNASATSDRNAEFNRVVKIVSNARSVLDSVEYYGANAVSVLHAMTRVVGFKESIYTPIAIITHTDNVALDNGMPDTNNLS